MGPFASALTYLHRGYASLTARKTGNRGIFTKY
jgi:hypothetical protein